MRSCRESVRPTRTISESTGEGRHTTVSTALFRIPGSGELIDSPGVRDYAPPPVEDAQVQVGWPEILALAPQCRFNNCLHLREPGCAVIECGRSGISSRRAATRATSGSSTSCADWRRSTSGGRWIEWSQAVDAGLEAELRQEARRLLWRSPTPASPCLIPTHAARQRMRERAAVDVFQLAADRHAVRDAARFHLVTCASSAITCAVASPSTVVFVARIASLTLPSASSASSCAKPELVGPDAVERRQMAHQHEVSAAIAARLLDRGDVRRRLDDAQQRLIARRRRADRTQLGVGEHPTALAAADALHCFLQRVGRAAPAPLRSFSSRWNAMRCADFGPTPGRQRNASIRRTSDGG